MTLWGKWAVIGVVVVGGATAAIVTARGQETVAPLVLHEDLTPPADQVARTAARAAERASGANQAVLGPDPAEGQNPQAISAGPKLLPEPSAASPAAKGETVFGEKSFGADRETESRPDYETGADGTLHYVEVFNPSVVPFKRMTSLDAVAPDYTLITDASTTSDITVGGKRRAGRELFWGSLAINLETGKEIAIPSVSADMGILSYEIEPQVSGLIFSKDRADNYYVRTDEAGVSGTHRLVFLADASSAHFSPTVPSGVRVRDLPSKLIPPMPAAVRRVAERGLHQLGLRDSMSLKVALDTLVRYFRNFEAREPPPRTSDIYWDLFVNQAGVCRHRSFAFMVTANALGIPTRYLANEAHAWVEVFIPRQGWVRVDLGGAALRLEVTGAEDKAMHGGGTDPFPKPPKYENNYTQLVGDIDGLTDDQIQERREGSIGDTSGGDGDGSGGNNGGSNGDFFDESEDAAGAEGRDAQGRLIGPGQGLPTIPDDELAGKTETTIGVTEVSPSGYRGESIQVVGTLTSRGVGIGGHVVNIFLKPVNSDENDSVRVGYGTSAPDGSFTATISIPTSFALSVYEVYASTPGDDTYAPSVSD